MVEKVKITFKCDKLFDFMHFHRLFPSQHIRYHTEQIFKSQNGIYVNSDTIVCAIK